MSENQMQLWLPLARYYCQNESVCLDIFHYVKLINFEIISGNLKNTEKY